MNKLTVIIPLHEYNDKVKPLLTKAVNSVLNDQSGVVEKLVIVHNPEFTKEITKDFKGKNIDFLANNTSIDFPTQVNFAVKNLPKTIKWFSILEHDDEYSKIYFKNFDKYSSYYNDVDIFFPISLNTNADGVALSLANNIAWAVNFQGITEPGFATLESLMEYPYLQFTGSIINREVFLKVGMMKTNFKIAYDYEFLLRIMSNGNKLMVIPKVGYTHMIDRPGSIFESQKQISPEEGRFWFETAKKEYFFPEEREIEYIA